MLGKRSTGSSQAIRHWIFLNWRHFSLYSCFLNPRDMIPSVPRFSPHRSPDKVSPTHSQASDWILMTHFEAISLILSKSNFTLVLSSYNSGYIKCGVFFWFKVGVYEFIQLQINASSNKLSSSPAHGSAHGNAHILYPDITLLMGLPINSFFMLLVKGAV